MLLALGLAITQACSHRPAELPSPLSSTTPSLSISEAQTWYQQLDPAAHSTARTSQAGRAAPIVPPTAALRWQRALTVGMGSQQLVLVPFAGDAALFARTPYMGMRYLVVAKQAPTSLDGKIVEVLLSRTTEQVDTLALFTSLYHSAQSGHLAAPGQGTGYVFLYSASYEYLSGRRFAQGQLLPGVTRLAFQPRAGTVAASGRTAGHRAPSIDAPCLDWYSGETGKYITTTGNCSSLGSGGSGDVPPVYTGGGGPCGGICGGSPGPSGYGGGGGVSTPPVVPLSETLVEITQLPPCASQVVSVIKNDNIKLSDALVPFFGSSLKFYPKISAKLLSDNNGKRVAGNTVRDGMNFDPVYNLPVYIININSGTLYGDTHGPGATNIGLAGTVLHELTHAYLIEWNRSKGNITDPNVTLSVLLEKIY